MKLFILILICPIIFACNGNSKSIQIGNEIIEGNIDKDSTYNGLIHFYNSEGHKLTSQATYRNGILEGKREIFYPNGKVQVSLDYRDGKPTGFSKFYNEQGQLESEQYFYYSLRVGHMINYRNNQPYNYSFTSLDNEMLLNIDYDSIGTKAINEILKEFFFYKKWPLQIIDFKNIIDTDQYFIYLPSPPRYKFTYSLCFIDNKYNVLKTIQTFDSTKIWDTITIDTVQKQKGQFLALKLQIDDQINDVDAVAFKKLQ